MTPEASQEYQRAVEEAANAFMKVMALRGFNVRDYPQNFVAQMAQQTRLQFEASRSGQHAEADALVAQFIQSGQSVPKRVVQTKAKTKTIPFSMLGRRAA
ncbi:MAG: hypothetical protein AAB176_12595 [Pseudomonadota bacterium]